MIREIPEPVHFCSLLADSRFVQMKSLRTEGRLSDPEPGSFNVSGTLEEGGITAKSSAGVARIHM